jgi:hypothetical protein
MLKFSKKQFIKEDVFVKENETSFGIFQKKKFAEMESSKLNNYSTKTQQTCYPTTILVFACILLGLPIMFKPCGLAHLV